jgi:hypothetical protein
VINLEAFPKPEIFKSQISKLVRLGGFSNPNFET